jgi:hypothetical protein
MALPITPTPILEGKEAVDFLYKIEKGLENPLTYIPTPNLWKVKGLIKNTLKNNLTNGN